MKKKASLFFTLIVCSIVFIACKPKETVPAIIFDTDMGPDYDDAGAITILHYLAANKECKILATVASNRADFTAPAIEAFNLYFGHPEIPVGAPQGSGPDIQPGNHWTDSIASLYLPRLKKNSDYPSAVSVYRKTLAKQPDRSVVIITVGFTTNLEALLKSKADSFSSLTGIDLIRKKVKKYVAMAGKFPEGKEFNVFADSIASGYVFANWPTPILFSGFEIGEKIMTGNRLAHSANNGPARWAYNYCLRTYAGKPVQNRSSWDLTAVLCAVRGPEKYFYLGEKGTFICNPDGSNSWDPDKNSDHQFLIHKYPYNVTASKLEEMMMYQPPPD